MILPQPPKDPRGSNMSSDLDSFDETSNDSSTRCSMPDEVKKRKANGNGNGGNGSKSGTQSGYSSCSETHPVSRNNSKKKGGNGDHMKSNNSKSQDFEAGINESKEIWPPLILTKS